MTNNLENHFIHDIMQNILSNDFPKLNVGNRKGVTDYIDYIEVGELTSPIMKGVDCYKRPFVVLKCTVDKDVYGQTFFQRYTNDSNLWMGCSLYGVCSFMSTIGGMTKHQALLLQNIIDGNSITLDENHKLTFSNETEKSIIVNWNPTKI